MSEVRSDIETGEQREQTVVKKFVTGVVIISVVNVIIGES